MCIVGPTWYLLWSPVVACMIMAFRTSRHEYYAPLIELVITAVVLLKITLCICTVSKFLGRLAATKINVRSDVSSVRRRRPQLQDLPRQNWYTKARPPSLAGINNTSTVCRLTTCVIASSKQQLPDSVELHGVRHTVSLARLVPIE